MAKPPLIFLHFGAYSVSSSLLLFSTCIYWLERRSPYLTGSGFGKIDDKDWSTSPEISKWAPKHFIRDNFQALRFLTLSSSSLLYESSPPTRSATSSMHDVEHKQSRRNICSTVVVEDAATTFKIEFLIRYSVLHVEFRSLPRPSVSHVINTFAT